MAQNYYDTLGIKKDASENDIKKAFRELSKKWHPDKFATKSDDEKKKAEQKFKEINEAYQTLSDPTKRQEYDNPAMGGFGGFNFGGFDPFGCGFNPFGGFRQQEERGSDIQVRVTIKLEDLFNSNNAQTKIKYNKSVPCSACNGTCGDKETCSHCGGAGRKREQHIRGNMTQIFETICPHCGGLGYTLTNKCNKCHGTGFEEHETTVDFNYEYLRKDLSLFANNNHNAMMRIPGMGNTNKQGKNPGDIVVYIYLDYDESKYRFSNTGVLHTIVDVPWYDALLGCDKVVEVSPNQYQNIIFEPNTKNGSKITRNINYTEWGQVVVVVNYTYPVLNDKAKELLKQLRDANNTISK